MSVLAGWESGVILMRRPKKKVPITSRVPQGVMSAEKVLHTLAGRCYRASQAGARLPNMKALGRIRVELLGMMTA